MSDCFKNDNSLSLTVSEQGLPWLLGVLVIQAFLYTSALLDGETLKQVGYNLLSLFWAS